MNQLPILIENLHSLAAGHALMAIRVERGLTKPMPLPTDSCEARSARFRQWGRGDDVLDGERARLRGPESVVTGLPSYVKEAADRKGTPARIRPAPDESQRAMARGPLEFPPAFNPRKAARRRRRPCGLRASRTLRPRRRKRSGRSCAPDGLAARSALSQSLRPGVQTSSSRAAPSGRRAPAMSDRAGRRAPDRRPAWSRGRRRAIRLRRRAAATGGWRRLRRRAPAPGGIAESSQNPTLRI